MSNIFVFSQNLILDSLKKYTGMPRKGRLYLFVTTHFLFENERSRLISLFGRCRFHTFADFLSDAEMAECDITAYTSKNIPYGDYLAGIKRRKNEIVCRRVLEKYPDSKRYILSDDLGIDLSVWRKRGFRKLNGSYYYQQKKSFFCLARNLLAKSPALKSLYHSLKKPGKVFYLPEEVLVGHYQGRKYVFLGSMNRIAYRLSISFESSPEECSRLNAGRYETKENCTYLTTWHERHKCRVPDEEVYAVRWAQDGYLPPNYTHCDYSFKPDNVVYYCWDLLGTQLFRNRNLPFELIPFRKKLYLPHPDFPRKISHILVAASGAGDWTALKNRSDDDLLVEAIVQMARRFPDISFTYRCHPAWVHPLNAGVHSIQRADEYFHTLGLKNLALSAHIPAADSGSAFQYSFSRSSLAEDLAAADFVIGEHSISMIDAAFQGIPFCSVNLTKRRNFFAGITDLGFPLCTSCDDLASLIEHISDPGFQSNYRKAVDNYNAMTDREA